MTCVEAVLASVRRIHDASLTADGWQPALHSVIDLLSGEHAVLLANDHARPDAAFAISAGLDQGGFARFVSPQAAQWLGSAMQAIRPGDVVTRSRVIPDRQFERTDFYNDVVRPVDGFYAIGVRHQIPALSSFINVCRSRRTGDFDTDDTAIMRTLAPHFATALRVRQRLGAADLAVKGAWAALDRLKTGMIVVDAAAAVVFANETAETLFVPGKLCLGRDGICLGDETTSRQLRRLIAVCTGSGSSHIASGGTVEVAGNERLAALRIEVSPFRAERIGLEPGFYSGPLALLLVSDPQQERRNRVVALQRRFRLTLAEAEFALEIIKGDGRAAAASRANISVGTARTHLEHIFEKTGVRRQAELVRLLLSDHSKADLSPRISPRSA